jgi:rare lipoprotein A
MLLILLLSILLLAACGHPKQAHVNVPPAPPPATAPAESQPPATEAPAEENAKAAPSTEEAGTLAEPVIPAGTKPIATETGLASWYGPPYHNRRAANGEVYNMHAMTAAHRTFPLGSVVRVTNVKTKATALVRITDRGPFIRGRILDLSLAAARKVDVDLRTYMDEHGILGPWPAGSRILVCISDSPLSERCRQAGRSP